MAATLNNIKSWINTRPEGTTHMVVMCDTFDWEDYPMYYPNQYRSDMSLEELIADSSKGGGNKLMEVYSFTGKYSLEDQFGEYRARHYD